MKTFTLAIFFMIENSFKSALSKLCLPEHKILVTVSGGKDSMALLNLLKNERRTLEVAHVNFKLRGEDSDADQALVEKYCYQHTIPFHVTSFDTKNYAKLNGISTQMAARELRYKWFYEILEKNNLDYIATAHHLNDNIETLLLNLCKGTGPKGLTGIPALGDKIIRPLLQISSEAIQNYLIEQQIEWREDLSNQENKYQRNKVRNIIVPELKKINPNLEKTISTNLDRFSELNEVFRFSLDLFKMNLIQESNAIKIPLSLIEEMPGITLILEEFLKEFGFTRTQIINLLESEEVGKKIYSSDYVLIKDRATWNLMLDEKNENFALEIPHMGIYTYGKIEVEISTTENATFGLKNELYMDASKISWPLTLRNPKTGDRFQPFGLKGSKLVSDFLKDEKIPTLDKQNQLILQDSETILWVVGLRTAQKTEINHKTQSIIRIKIQNLV